MGALPTLLQNLVDYAGLFPPAKLPMTEAVRHHATYLRSAQNAALGRFIVPLARLGEFETAHAGLGAEAGPGWQLSVIAGPQPAADWAAIQDFHARQSAVRIVSVETKAATPAEVAASVAGLPTGLEAWIEVSPTAPDLPALLAAIKTTGHGAKLRTGGVTPEAFPAPASVIRFMALCRAHGLVFKATAGLHHPLRGDYRLTYEPGSPCGRMFGFLNVFLAATLLHHGGGEADALALLDDGDAANFRSTSAALAWRGHEFSLAQLAATRQQFCRSFGSCSFTEPLEGLHELHWL